MSVIINFIGEVLGGIFPLLRKIFKPVFFFIAFIVLFVLVVTTLTLGAGIGISGQYLTILGPDKEYLAWAGVIALFFLIVIPFLTLIHYVLRLLFNYRWPSSFSNTLAYIWSFAWVVGFLVATITFKDLSHKYESTHIETYGLEEDIIKIEMPREATDSYMAVHLGDFGFTTQNDNWAIKNVGISLEKSVDDQLHVKKIIYSRGRSESKAADNVNLVQSSMVQSHNNFTLSKYINLPINKRFRGQKVEYVFYIPKGKALEFDKAAYKRIKSKSKYTFKSKELNDNVIYQCQF